MRDQSSRREGCDMRQIKPRAAPQNQVVQTTELGDAFVMTHYTTIVSLFAFATTAIVLQTSPALAFSSEAQQMCTGDAMRLCSSEIPDISRVRACMVQKKAQVSPGCRAVMDREHAAARKREAAAQ
ncbi:hypothetical protein ABID62_008652 [Bradyrhizobium sp. S3.9.1]|jgi:hypothetical protein